MGNKTEYASFVVGTARTVVAALAPDESDLVDVIGEAFVRDPDRVLSTGGRAPVLGSGIGTVVTMVTPVALAVAASVYQHLVDKAGKSLVDGGAKVLRKLFGDDGDAEVRRVVVARAVELGRSPEEAERIAEVVVAELNREQG